MKKRPTLFALILSLALITGCDHEDDDGTSGDRGDATVDVSGTWTGTLTVAGQSETETFTLMQNGNNVTSADAGDVNYSGTVSGNRLELFATISEGSTVGSLDLSGDVNGDQAELSGTITAGGNGLDLSLPATLSLRR